MSAAIPPLPHTPSWCDRKSIGGWGKCKVASITVPLAMPITGSVVTQTQTLASSHSANKIRCRYGINYSYKTTFNVTDTAIS